MIRKATVADVPAMLEIYAPHVLTTTNSFEYEVPSAETFTERLTTYTKQFPWLVWEENGCVKGYAYASLPFSRPGYRWCCEVSIYLAPETQRKGVGKALYAVLEYILWQQGYRTIYSVVTGENAGSLAFHHKVGYEFFAKFPNCGYKFGKTLDVIWLQKQSNIVETPTQFPVSWTSIVKNDEKLTDILANLSLS